MNEAREHLALDAGHPEPVALGVTVLTSDVRTDAFDERVGWAKDAGCGGVVCAASEAARARAVDMRAMVPGIRMPRQAADDQARVATPGEAIRAGADWILIGRAITRAEDPESVAAAVAADVESALRGGSRQG